MTQAKIDIILHGKNKFKTISITEALALAAQYGKVTTRATLIKWVDEHEPKLGHQPSGNNGLWYIFEEPFILFISGQEALCKSHLATMLPESESQPE